MESPTSASRFEHSEKASSFSGSRASPSTSILHQRKEEGELTFICTHQPYTRNTKEREKGRRKRGEKESPLYTSTMQASSLFHTHLHATAHSNTTSEESWRHDSLGAWQLTYLSTKLGWRHGNKSTHHKPAGLVRPSSWCAMCLHMYRASTVAVKHGTAGSTH